MIMLVFIYTFTDYHEYPRLGAFLIVVIFASYLAVLSGYSCHFFFFEIFIFAHRPLKIYSKYCIIYPKEILKNGIVDSNNKSLVLAGPGETHF